MSGLKTFFENKRLDEITEAALRDEISRLEIRADKLEYDYWQSDPHLEAAKMLRDDAQALKTMMARVMAGQQPVPPFQKGVGYAKRALVLDSGAIWQRTGGENAFTEPGRGSDWTVVAGTPAPKAAPIPPVMDTSLDLAKHLPNKTAEDRKELKFAQAVERRVKNAIEEGEFSESALKRPISLRFLLVTRAVIAESVIEALASRDDKIRDLTKRIEEMEAGGIKYCGVWQRAISYSKGSLVTEGGSAWIAVRASAEGEKPGASEAWQLAVKAGRDAASPARG